MDPASVDAHRSWLKVVNETGKRYVCGKCGAEMIVTKGGDGAVACCGEQMSIKK